jgi:hypothetical protein
MLAASEIEAISDRAQEKIAPRSWTSDRLGRFFGSEVDVAV